MRRYLFGAASAVALGAGSFAPYGAALAADATATATATASDASSASGSTQVGEITVTGSLIVGTPKTAALPVTW